jgi:DNA repair exonuclease SbcCD ATPase subunit
MYTTKHAQKLYDVKSDQTIRNWIKEFRDFFSIDATPGKGIDLILTEEDMRVLDLICEMRRNRRPPDEIYATLKSGQRGNLPPYTVEELDLWVKGDYEKHLSTQLNELNLKIDQLKQENEELRSALQPIRDKNIQLEAERGTMTQQVEDLKDQLERERTRGQDQLERLLREMAELRYKMGILEKGRDE